MADFNIYKADYADASVLCDIFLGHISAHSEYISHGEIQMGVGVGHFEDGAFVTDVGPAFTGLAAACQIQVRFFALHRIKPHAPLLVRAPVNFFEF